MVGSSNIVIPATRSLKALTKTLTTENVVKKSYTPFFT